ncbi:MULTISPECIES: TolC family outer membrane protein [unclassified Paracoccus (in: a-proteobacteria)]|uniref:TolC family outer membrane protein n=1 Tax=unclassified Paracoccus (in: a-proteobacteria) TaxID=2688777 RepID=UPI0012B350CB|nr:MULTISPECIES: TolC family outer membrane protein [unclassified Paracoccus (in: a-proteobacteria)]UXU75818.1 TolC family outer membrane protein [Paracoccus sp. SMMA_5]UXU81727.1 TolC family outer membrane protein [Paracoccus sp. SMMA_5_TC]
MVRNLLKALRRPLIAALFASATALPATAESLADAMVAAYRHSALLEQNRAVLRAADEDAASALARLRPVVQWIASHSYTQTEGVSSRSSQVALNAQVTLYDWGRTALAIDIAKETVLATRAALVDIEQQVLLDAVRAYLDVRSTGEQVELQSNSVRVIGQEQRAASDRFEVGEITQTDVAQANAALAAARAGLAAAQGNLSVARENYRAATGKAPGKLSPPPPTPKLPASLEAARQIAQRTHPQIQRAQRLAAAAELGVAAAAAERNPTLNAEASIGRSRGTSTSILNPGATVTRDSGTVGLQMSQTIYSGGRLPSAHRKAMARRDEIRAGLLQTSRAVDQAVGTAWAGIDVARAQIRAIDEQIAAARQAYEGVREEATLGARTTLDVLDAEQSLLAARADKIAAEANLQLAHYQLLAAMGLLTVENLKLGIPTYDPSAYYNAVQDAPFTSKQGQSLDRVLRAIGKD